MKTTLTNVNDLCQDLVPKLKTSPSKNPFQKKIAVVERFGEDHGSHVINESSGPGDQFTNEEDVDDPGFESSTSLTPCSPANVRMDLIFLFFSL